MLKIKLSSIFIFCALVFTSCSVSKQARTYENNINGTWQLQTVETEGIKGQIKASFELSVILYLLVAK